MAVNNYERILEKISQISGVDRDEVLRRIEAKRAKLSGLISPEGAAQIVAAELGVSFDNERLKLDEIISGMRKVNVVGKIIRTFPVRTFKTQKGDEGKVLNLVLADDTSNVKVVLWDTNHISLFENNSLGEESVVEILNASVRDGEIHLGSFSDIKPSLESLDKLVTEKVVSDKKISELKISDSARVRAFIVQSFEPRFFEVNKETGKKASDEDRQKGAEIERRALINIVLDDGSETIRAVLFHENLKLIGLSNLDSPEELLIQRNSFLGKEFIFLGNVRKNNYFNNEEFIVDSVESADIDHIIKTFESN